MSANLSRKQQKAATRVALLAASRRTFITGGIANTAITEVARAAGVAHGTFYVHFANKDAVVRELLAEFNAEFAGRVSAALERATSRSTEWVVRRVAETFLTYWEQERAFIECVAEHMVAGLSLADMRDGVNPPMATLLATALTALAKQRRVRAPQTDLLGHALLAMWLRLGLRYLFAEDVSRKKTLAMLVALTTAAIDAALPVKED